MMSRESSLILLFLLLSSCALFAIADDTEKISSTVRHTIEDIDRDSSGGISSIEIILYALGGLGVLGGGVGANQYRKRRRKRCE